jgi:hypothetical protein
MFFLNQEGRHIFNETVRLTKRKQTCTSQQVYLRVSAAHNLVKFTDDHFSLASRVPVMQFYGIMWLITRPGFHWMKVTVMIASI